MSRLTVRAGLSALLAVAVAGGQGVAAFGAPSTVAPSTVAPSTAAPSTVLTGSHDKRHRIEIEQSDADSAAKALRLDPGEDLVVKDVIADRDGTTNVRYDRTYQGLRVIGGDLVSHRDSSGAIRSVSGNTSDSVAVASTTPRIKLASARAIGARKASSVQHRTSSTTAQLVVYVGSDPGRTTPKLAYDVLSRGTLADRTPSRIHTIVDAGTGAARVSWDEIESGIGNGKGLNVGTVSIDTTAGPLWSMRDAVGDATSDLNGAVAGLGDTFTSSADSWGDGTNTDRSSAGVDAHYGAATTFDYFKTVLGRSGIAGDGVGTHSRVHFGDNVVNAFWDGSQMTYGDGPGNAKPLVELDIAGHEMTHGVTQNTADLLYAGESGGLSEATSDIFGTAVEWHANNAVDTPDYTIGELVDFNGNGTPLRYMDRPSRDGASPDCWSSTVGALDTHSSSGPLNHWFYLASEGSGAKVINGISYDSPTCDASTVTPIGRDKAAKIWYRTLSVYLTSNSTYAVAREGAIQSAMDLYGASSPECAGTAASFSAIAVPAGALSCGVPPPSLGGNLLTNPGFESGEASWTGTDGPISSNTGRPTHSGSWKMWLGGHGSTANESEWQSVTIPAGAVEPKLSFWIRTDTSETGSTEYDTMKVQAISGTSTSTLATYSNVDATSTYSQQVLDLTAYTGRTIVIKFLMKEDPAQQTSFVIDDTAVTTLNNSATHVTFSPLDFTGDARSDVMRVTSTGDLYLYRGDGLGGFSGPGTKMATVKGVQASQAAPRWLATAYWPSAGWTGFLKVFSPGDFTGDGKSDIFGVRSNGDLWLYRGDGLGGIAGAGTRIGGGWGVFSKLLSAGDFTGDGKADILAVNSRGGLYLYRGNGLGGFSGAGTLIGGGWHVFGAVFSPGDFTGDGKSDILAVRANGDLYLYRGNGLGGFAGAGTMIAPA